MAHRPKTTLAQERDDDHDQEGTTSDGTTNKGTKPYALTHQNLMFYPLARNRHTKSEWKPSDNTGRWLCDLTGDIQLRLPATTDIEHRFGPNAFDMSILLQCLALERIKGQHEFEITASGLIRGIDLTVTGANLKRLENSLWLWSNLGICHRHWYDKGKHIKRLLPPPLHCDRKKGHRRLRIKVNEAWIWSGNAVPVPFPLPNEATVMNLVLYLLAQWKPVTEINRAVLCAKLGLSSHDENKKRLKRALDAAKYWYGEHGGGFKAEIGLNGKIRFTLSQPEMVWERLGQQQHGIVGEQAMEMLRQVREGRS
jgi:hypothetical protein